MAQAFLLKTDVAMTNIVASQPQTKNHAVDNHSKAEESFSSALDKQVEQHTTQQHKKTNKSDVAESKTDTSEEKSGKVLPKDDESTATTDKVDGKDEKKQGDDELPVEGVISPSGASVPEDQTALLLNGQEQTTTVEKNVVENKTEKSKLVADIALLNKTDNAKIEVQAESETEGETTENKQALRSDILNALLKKPKAEGEKQVATEQKIATNLSLIPTRKAESNDEQQVIALANNLKLKGSLSATGTLERSTVVTTSPLTPSSSLATNNVAATTAATGQPTLNLQPALQSEAWGRVLSSRVIWMAREGVQQASLKLNPANMGPVEVKLHMHNDQANISFIAHHAATRDALEQALPRLRESFQENGMELTHADVSQENFAQADEQDDNKTSNNGSTSERDNLDTDHESGHHEANISEQDITAGLSVFA
ncbi:hypothetical protein LCGC14_1169640 [marine sediment metagenome]|uniref:Flagellar hook-length control protein-like C-terminal domain-containing protein n=1 Tax=marine sediment metagenome TaxID=412755 RepID=A0A0F9MD80_9ZZZZ|nr:flagellar hook-length control protein FliK [Methylophaga sp.]